MTKWYLLLLLLLPATLHAQAPESAYEQYLDYNLLRFEGNTVKAFNMGKQLLDSADKLPANTRISFFYSIGKLYEDNKEPEKATPLYEQVAAAAPNYYVVHRALGYIYLQQLNQLQAKLDAAPKNTVDYTNLKAAYKAEILKVLPHLEIAQACDPSDETLGIIKTLYTNIGDSKALNTLNERLAAISKNCLDILNDTP